MRIKLMSIMVDDQDKALKFYTDVLGFKKKLDIPMGQYRWLTVISQEGPDDIELILEPNANPAGKAFQQAMFEQKIPVAIFESADIQAEAERMKSNGAVFTLEPKDIGPVFMARFEDTCGNLIQMVQPKG
jgi:glyoxylase I family protein